MGLHMNGNDAAVDSLGFVKPDMGFGKVKTSHIFNRILDDEVNNSDNNEWRQVDNCWICEKWSENEFIWEPGVSGPEKQTPVLLHLDIDNYKGDLMEQQIDGTFKLHRMLPPKQVKFFFTFGGEPTID